MCRGYSTLLPKLSMLTPSECRSLLTLQSSVWLRAVALSPFCSLGTQSERCSATFKEWCWRPLWFSPTRLSMEYDYGSSVIFSGLSWKKNMSETEFSLKKIAVIFLLLWLFIVVQIKRSHEWGRVGREWLPLRFWFWLVWGLQFSFLMRAIIKLQWHLF